MIETNAPRTITEPLISPSALNVGLCVNPATELEKMDFKIGDIVKFDGAIYRITANGDRPGTFDIVRHPDEMAGDRWRNVWPRAFRILTHNV